MSSTPSVRLFNGRAVNRLDVLAELNVGQSDANPNYVKLTGGETGGGPTLAAFGSDVSVPITIAARADSTVNLHSNGNLSAEFYAPSNAVNAFSFSAAATGQAVAIRTAGTDTNRSILIAPAGTGTLTVTSAASFQGAVTLSGPPTSGLHAATKAYVDAVVVDASGLDLSDYVEKAGSTMTGALTLSGAPTAALHAATKQYVDDSTSSFSTNYLAKSGGTMTGFITLHADPTSALHAATKQYVDDIAGTGGVTSVAGKTGDVVLESADVTDFEPEVKALISWEAGLYVKGRPDSGGVLVRHEMRQPIRFETDLNNWAVNAGVAANATSVFSVRKNNVEFATITINAAATTESSMTGTQTDFASGDLLTIIAPTPQDDTLADFGITMNGVRL